MVIEIKQLEEPIEITLEQFECDLCHKKIYVNVEDKPTSKIGCPFCVGSSNKVRIFQIKIEGIGEY